MLRNALYGGMDAAAFTAVNADLPIDPDRMAAHCQWLPANGGNGLAELDTSEQKAALFATFDASGVTVAKAA